MAFVLGAVLSPTDPVAATAVGRRVGAPRRVITIVEGESLVNDATALVAYKFAVAAVLSGAFSLGEASGSFVLDAAAGIAIGRGGVSLAAALAIPLTVEGGGPFPDRELVIFLVYATILTTLLVQGLSLPLLIRRLGLDGAGQVKETRLENKARMDAARAAVQRLEELQNEDWVREDTYDRLHRSYEYRERRFRSRFDEDGSESESIESRSADFQRLTREMLEAQRERILELRREGTISDDIMHRIERDLDLEDTRLEI